MKYLDKVPFQKIVFVILIVIAASVPLSVVYKIKQDQALANRPVDVLQNWKITVPDGEYQPGDVIKVTSEFKKVLDIAPTTSDRYIQCLIPGTTEWDSLIPANKGVRSNPVTEFARTVYDVGIPLSIGQLPNTCRVYSVITYNVNKYNPTFQEVNWTNNFKVVAREGIVQNGDETYIYRDSSPKAQNDPQSSLSPEDDPIIIYRSSPQETDVDAPEDSNPLTLMEPLINLNVPVLDANICVIRLICVK